jgi:hypothetical protein
MPKIKAHAQRPESLGPWLSLIYSRCFFHAFPFQENRVEQWRLIYALVVEGRPALTRKHLNDVLDESQLGNEHKLVTKLLFDQQRKKCIVLEIQSPPLRSAETSPVVPKEKKSSKDSGDIDLDTRIVLDPYLYEKIERYIEEFLLCTLPQPPHLDRRAQSLKLMREVYEFQMLRANPSWNIFIRELTEQVEKNPNLDSAEFRLELRESSEHWLLLHGLMVLSLENEDMKWSTPELLNFISHEVTTFVKDRKFRSAIVYLDKHGVLENGRRGKEKIYGISPTFRHVFDRYNQTLISMRDELTRTIHKQRGIN